MTSIPRLELRFLDGLRGVLMLMIVVGHAGGNTGLDGATESALPWLWPVFPASELRVPMFFVISGYALMIAVARDPGLRLRGGFRGHVTRRARRLVPPYLAALALGIALVLLVPGMNVQNGTPWDPRVPLTVESVVAHALLVHNVSPDLFFTLNGTLWTMAVEWQLGLLMPLVLVLWRRVRPTVVIAVMFAIWAASSVSGVLSWSAPILLAVFGMGMYAAYLVHGDRDALDRRRSGLVRAALDRPTSSLAIAAGLLVVAFVIGWIGPEQIAGVPTVALRWGLAALSMSVFLVVMTHREAEAPETRATRSIRAGFSWGPLRWLGLVSYSVYLVHSPLLAVANLVLLPFGLPTAVVLVVQLVVTVPVIVAIGAGFAWLVERPVMNSHQRRLLSELGPRFLRARTSGTRAPRTT